MEKEERKKKKILTDNRLVTVNKRETSLEGLTNQFEGGKDGVYNVVLKRPDKQQIFKPKISITQRDIETIPSLKQLRQSIHLWEKGLKDAVGRDIFTIKKALIEMRRDQYIIKQAYQKPVVFKKILHTFNHDGIDLEDTSTVYWNPDDPQDPHNGEITISGISLMNPAIVSAILRNYSILKQDSWDKFDSDIWYLLQDFDDIAGKAFEDEPYYLRIVEYKVDGMQNVQIQEELNKEFAIKHSFEHISSLWRNKIPKMIAATAVEDFLTYYYKTNNLPFKKCSKCGQFKPTHNTFFSKNKTSKDGFYSICKACRNKKKGEQL